MAQFSSDQVSVRLGSSIVHPPSRATCRRSEHRRVLRRPAPRLREPDRPGTGPQPPGRESPTPVHAPQFRTSAVAPTTTAASATARLNLSIGEARGDPGSDRTIATCSGRHTLLLSSAMPSPPAAWLSDSCSSVPSSPPAPPGRCPPASTSGFRRQRRRDVRRLRRHQRGDRRRGGAAAGSSICPPGGTSASRSA